MKRVLVTIAALAVTPVAAAAQTPPTAASSVTCASSVEQRSAGRQRAFRAAREERDARLRDLALSREMTTLALSRLRAPVATTASVQHDAPPTT